MHPDDIHDAAKLATEARTIRLAAQRLQRHARDWTLNRAMSSTDETRVKRELGTIRHSLDTLFAIFGKPDR